MGRILVPLIILYSNFLTMKKCLFFSAFIGILFFTDIHLAAQVAINRDGSLPDSSAILDVKSSNKGFLLPRMTHAEVNNIPNPANGLQVYCSDCGTNNMGSLLMFMAGAWYTVNVNCLNPLSPPAGTHIATPTQITWNWNQVVNATGYKWNTTSDYSSASDMGTNTSKTEEGLTCFTPYTRYVWTYSPCGVSSAKMLSQTTSIIFITTPIPGTHIPMPTQIVWNWNTVSDAIGYKWNNINDYNSAIDMGLSTSKMETNLTCNTSYVRYVWAYNVCGYSTPVILTQSTSPIPPDPPTSGTQVSFFNQIIWNWNPVAGATGYKWNAINDYASANDIFTNTTITETGLNYGTIYTRYAWSYNNCGHSISSTMIQTTMPCGSSFVINHIDGAIAPVPKIVTYGTVTNIPGENSKCWITQNLGSDHQATSRDDATENSAGWYWQFNRKQGYKHDGTIRTPNSTWITAINENNDWLSENDPCTLLLGSGWRIPTFTEWTNVDASGNWTNWNGPWNSALKLHASGGLYAGGSLGDRGYDGTFWSSNQFSITYGQYILFSNLGSIMDHYDKSVGYTLRCLKD